MKDGKILMELLPGSNAEKILSNIEGVSIVDLHVDRIDHKDKKGILTTPRAIAKELFKDETHFLIGHSTSPGAYELEIVLYYKGEKIARTASRNIQPKYYYEIKGSQLKALCADWDCLNQIFGKI